MLHVVTAIQPPAEPNALPDWVTETPREMLYTLEMFSEDNDLQDVQLTRAEFIALKQHLVEMRGYKVSDAAREENAA